MRMIFFGTSSFAIPALEALVNAGYEIPLVITTPGDSPIRTIANRLSLSVIQPESLKDPAIVHSLSAISSSLGLVASYGKIIPQWLIEKFPRGLLNIHPSLLPQYRGPSPIQSALLNGETETGVSLMLIDAEVDHGPLIATEKTTIGEGEYNIELSQRLFRLGGELLVRVLPDYLAGKITPQPQDHSQATFTKKFTPEDGKIDWQKSAREIYNQIRALNPEPGTFTLLNSRSDNLTGWTSNILKITKANLSTSDVERLAAGQIIKDGKTLLASTGNGWLEILELQPAGKKPMPAAAFLNGYRGNWPIQCGWFIRLSSYNRLY